MRLLLVAAAASCAYAYASADADLQQLQNGFVASQLAQDAAGAAALDAGVAANSSLIVRNATTGELFFSDVDYNITTPAWWPAFFHVKRASLFAAAHASPLSRFFNDSTFLEETVLPLISTWLAHDFGAPDALPNVGWWYQQVGCPDAVARFALLPTIQPRLSAAQQAVVVRILNRANAAYGCPDANCVWLASNALYRGLFTGDAVLVNASIATVFGTMRVWELSNGGIQKDGSFGMHGPLLYSGGYGMEYIQGITNSLLWTRGTRFAMPPGDARLAVFTDFVLDGSASMMGFSAGSAPYGPAVWDLSSIGREIARPYGADWFSQVRRRVTCGGLMCGGTGSLTSS